MSDLKKCKICGIEKSINCFYKARTTTDGREHHCIDCRNGRPPTMNTPRIRTRDHREIPTEKTCHKCGKVKNLTEFYKNSGCWDGHVGTCIECQNGGKPRSRRTILTEIPTEKVCLGCGKLLPLDNFWRGGNNWLGRVPRCKKCMGWKGGKPKPKVADHRIIMPDEIPVIEKVVAPANPYLHHSPTHPYHLPKVKATIQDQRLIARCISCRAIITPDVGNPGPHGIYQIRCQSCKTGMIAIPVVA